MIKMKREYLNTFKNISIKGAVCAFKGGSNST